MKTTQSVFLAAVLLGGCASVEGPVIGAKVDVNPQLPEIPSEWAQAGIVGELPQGDWLSQFDDPTMVALVDEAMAGNPNLQAAEARVRVARETARSIFGRSLPSVNYSFTNGYSSNFSSQALGGGVVVDGRFAQPQYNQGLQFSWELDLWGRVRASNRAAQQDHQASEADYAAAQLALAGQTAIAWINLNSALQLQEVTRRTYEARQRIVELTDRRFARGLNTALDVRTARTQLATSEAAIAGQQQATENAARQLETLLGRYPAAEIEASGTLPTLSGITSLSNPTLLLARRPDIAAAEARLEAAGLRAEQARLALLPAFRLNSGISNSSSIEFADILDPQRLSANIIGALTQTIWAGGSLRADKKSSLANAEAFAATYTNTVLTAWREVEDALAADRFLNLQLDAQLRALEEATQAEELATRQYQNGLVSIFNLLQSQTTRLTSEASVVQATATRAVNRVNYHMALGGASDPSEAPDAAPADGATP
ncbi:MAG: efflux transporter outer membrane subunit [Hyphomonadaceae bacterium]